MLVTHELPSIFELGDDAVFLDAERKTMIARGTPEELQAQPRSPRCGPSWPGAAVSAEDTSTGWSARFVLGAIALVLVAIVAAELGQAGSSARHHFTIFFPGSVRGLNPGAPVTFRGVKVGEVDEVDGLPHRAGRSRDPDRGA